MEGSGISNHSSSNWFSENSWPLTNKYYEEKDGVTPDKATVEYPDWFADKTWPASTKCEKKEKYEKKERESAENKVSDESWLREAGWPVPHKIGKDVTDQPFEDFDYRLSQHSQSGLLQQTERTQSCCAIL